MSLSIGRFTRLLSGIIVAVLGVFLMVQTAPVAYADQLVSVKPDTVTKYSGCAGKEGAYFVITQIAKDDAPTTISVELSDNSTVTANRVVANKNTSHYYYEFPTAGLTVTDATASVPNGWKGQFNVSHCTGDEDDDDTPVTTTVTAPPTTTVTEVSTTTVTTTEPAVTVTTTEPATTTVTQFQPTTVTETVPDTTTVTQFQPTTVTTTEPAVTVTTTETQSQGATTVTIPTTLTVTADGATQTVPTTITVTVPAEDIGVAGVSDTIDEPEAVQEVAPIEVAGVSSVIPQAAPSANAHTGEGPGPLPWILLLGGAGLIASSWGFRRGAHRR